MVQRQHRRRSKKRALGPMVTLNRHFSAKPSMKLEGKLQYKADPLWTQCNPSSYTDNIISLSNKNSPSLNQDHGTPKSQFAWPLPPKKLWQAPQSYSDQTLGVEESDGLGKEAVAQSGCEGPDASVPLSRRFKWDFNSCESNVIPAEVSLVCVVKPDEFWDKKVTHFCFWKEKDRLGFEVCGSVYGAVILVSANKLTRYIEPCQLTDEFGGSLQYDHMDWVNKRLVFEKFTKESTSLLDELAVINENEKASQPDKTGPSDSNALPSFDPEAVLQTGHELLSELQQRRFNGSEGGGGGGGGTAWSPMDDELLAQPQVMKLLDSLREQYTKYQEVCRQRSKRSQLEEIQTKVMQVVNWLEGPGTEQLRTQWGIGDSIRASQALLLKHEEIESQHSEWFAVYVELNQQMAALLSAGDDEDLLELKALQQQLSDVCYRQASQLEFRQNVLQSAHEFHGTAQDLSQQLDGLLGMLCADVAPADGAAIQQTLKHLEEKLKSVEGALQTLREKGQVLLDQISNQTSWFYGKEMQIENKENVDHIHSVMEDMQLRKQRCGPLSLRLAPSCSSSLNRDLSI
ncbi:hypothetical protein NFI96_031892 [Prochilodus magdalenae]|nr:hypothetical protein NFI96_031892 [Prochilodus magdalenae]